MDTRTISADDTQAAPHEGVLLLGMSLAAVVLSSLDQCTRGPSLTALLLTNLQRFC